MESRVRFCIRSMRALVALLPALALAVPASGQTGAVTGSVTGESGEVLPSVQVFFPALSLGALTNQQGRFLIPSVPVGRHEIRAEVIGRQTASMQVDVQAGQTAVADLVLASRAVGLAEMVVTGVAAATPQAELAFTVDQVSVPESQPTIVSTAGGLIQGRVAGAKVISGSGLPGTDPSIQLRGPTSITGSQEPLIIIDGVISRGRLSDVNPMDIASIEVVKGAAAASLYGSRAQAGVIEITTKRGAGVEVGSTEITVRSTFQANGVENFLRLTNSHPYRVDGSGNFLNAAGNPVTLPANESEIALDDGGSGADPFRAFADNPFPGPTSNPMESFFTPGNSMSTYVSIAGNEGTTRYRASGRYAKDEGVVQFHNGVEQLNFRLNVDQTITDDLTLSLSGYVADVEQDMIDQGGGGIIRDLTFLSALAYDLGARDEDGNLNVVGDPIGWFENPLYGVANEEWIRDRQRVMGGADLQYTPTSWLTLQGNVSYDRSDISEDFFQPPGFERTQNRPPLTGRARSEQELQAEMNASLTASVTKVWGDFTSRSRMRWLVEDQHRSGFSASGSQFAVYDVPRLGLITGPLSVDSFEENIRSEGLFFISALTYQGKYIADFLLRRDGSSLFGSEERWQNYYRVSTAWRMSQESWWPFDVFTEFKPRFSIGTSGGRPGFNYQYQTYSVSQGQISPGVLGNNQLRPEHATEREWGLDAVIADRVRIQANYVDTEVDDQLLLVPLTSYFGFESQWQNAGAIESQTWEGVLEAALVERPNFIWTSRVSADRTRSEITRLDVPEYEIRDYRARMLIKEGEVLGAFYGTKWANNCAIDLPAGVDCGLFQVNDDGLLVYVGQGNQYTEGMTKELWGTTGTTGGETYDWGMPIQSDLDDGFTKLGESLPDVNVSWLQDVQWNDFGFSLLLDGEFGGQIYNQTRQWCTRSHCGDYDQAGKPDESKKPIVYYGAAGLYQRNLRSSWFVEDSDYVKLRELSVRYTLQQGSLPSFLQRVGIDRATFNVSGRNLKTWTDYQGYDPEVGKSTFGGSAAVGRIDEYFYPNYRSFGFDLELVF